MPRPLRITAPNLYYHIINRGNNRQLVFRDDKDFTYFITLLKRYKNELEFKLYHFCLMPNHLHLVIKPTIDRSLPKIMLKLDLAYATYLNKKYNNTGHVWQGRYRSSLIDSDSYFINCGLYVELNPVRAGLVKNPEDWPWSSYRFYISETTDPLKNNLVNPFINGLIDMDPYYLELGEDNLKRQNIYREYIKKIIDEEFTEIIRQGLRCGIYGDQEFKLTIQEQFKINPLMSRGRPVKIKEISQQRVRGRPRKEKNKLL